MNVYLRVNFWVIFLWLRNNNGIFEIFVQILVLSSLDSILDLIVSPQNFRIEVLTLTWWVNSSPLNLHFKYMHILCLILWVGKRISSEIDSQLSSRYGHKLNLIFVFLNIFYALVPCLENSWHSLSSVLYAASSLLVVPCLFTVGSSHFCPEPFNFLQSYLLVLGDFLLLLKFSTESSCLCLYLVFVSIINNALHMHLNMQI